MGDLCIIPARGGSKRIPRKNIKLFHGKPIIAYSIEAALQSGLFAEVMVSTDDKEIAEIAIQFGASVPFLRSKQNADDFATTFDVIEEVVYEYKQVDKTFENICCLYSCAPLVSSTRLNEAHKVLMDQSFDSVFPILQFSYPIQRALSLTANQKVDFIHPENSLTRSQDLNPSYHDAGQFYWMNSERCLKAKNILTENTGSILLTEMEAQDIDTPMDWKMAEIKYKMLRHE